MNTLSLAIASITLGFILTSSAMAQTMSKEERLTSRNKISSDYKQEKTDCERMSGTPKNICMAEANGKEKVQLSELDARYTPSTQTLYQVSIAKAEVRYEISKERCTDMTGSSRDTCIKEAKAVEIDAKAEAKAQMNISKARKNTTK